MKIVKFEIEFLTTFVKELWRRSRSASNRWIVYAETFWRFSASSSNSFRIETANKLSAKAVSSCPSFKREKKPLSIYFNPHFDSKVLRGEKPNGKTVCSEMWARFDSFFIRKHDLNDTELSRVFIHTGREKATKNSSVWIAHKLKIHFESLSTRSSLPASISFLLKVGEPSSFFHTNSFYKNSPVGIFAAQ